MAKQYSNGYALVVGVGADLPVTVQDAIGISNILKDESRCAFIPDNIKLLKANDANKSNIISALKWLAESSNLEDTVIIYFSGHGIRNPDFHLIPNGFKWDDIENTAISEKELSTYIAKINSKKIIVLLDCCHAGGQVEFTNNIKAPIPERFAETLQKSKGKILIASSRKDEKSYTGKPYSEFTNAVVEAFAGYGAFEDDGYVRILDMATWITRKVPDRTNEKQHPILKISNLEDNFAIGWYASGDKGINKLNWSDTEELTLIHLNEEEKEAIIKMLKNYRNSLLLIEERISQFVEFSSVPLQYIMSKKETENKIIDLQNKLKIT